MHPNASENDDSWLRNATTFHSLFKVLDISNLAWDRDSLHRTQNQSMMAVLVHDEEGALASLR
jgi:hypothetical protein